VLTRPYWSSEERWQARGLLAVIVAINLGQVYLTVLYVEWQNRFYNALQKLDIGAFYHLLGYFGALAAGLILAGVYSLYLNQMLQIRWRRWLTDRYLEEWIASGAYYRMQLTDHGTDNPDQRISVDLASYVGATLSLTLGLLSSVVTLFSFIVMLWQLSGALSFHLAGHAVTIPGYMVWVALLYAIVGSWLTYIIGRPLVALNFNQQKYEANFRFSLVRFRENAESVALYRGEDDEIRGLKGHFGDVFRNWWGIMVRQKQLTWFQSGYGQIAVIFPFVVAAPRYFSGAMELGGLVQTASAFGQVQGALSWFVNAYASLADWKATVDRLTGFRHAIERARHAMIDQRGIQVRADPSSSDYRAEDLSVDLPDGRPLFADLDLRLESGHRLLVTGASGAGKSTLFRALAGIWPFGRGTVHPPGSETVLFVPQKPYLTIAPLRNQLSYPDAPERFSEAELDQALGDCGLLGLAGRLDETRHWAQELSLGEQQRIGFARALLHKPQWLFLDEATASLDEPAEQQLYALLRTRLPDTTVVSIGHRSSLAAFHEDCLEIRRGPQGVQIAGAPLAAAAMP
jgi:putative ATP-binding cassette transporter